MISKIKKPISIVLALMMVVSLFAIVPITASAAEKELTETFNLGEYCHYDEDWEEVLADAHTGVNVTVAPTGNYIYVQDNCWFTHDDQWHEAIRVTVNNGDVIRKIVIKEYFYDCDTWRVCVNGRTIPGTTTTIDEDYNWVTFETVNAAQALIESPSGALVEQLIVYYGDPVPTTHTVTWKNGDTVLKTDTVEDGTTPTYDGTAPEQAEDEQYTYTFSGWSDGTNTYGASDTLPAVTGDVTYTAQFDATPKAHQHDGITFDKWTSADSLPAAAGNYVLTSDVTLSGTWTVPEGETNLCLAGYTIRQSGSGSVILLNNDNKKLTVYDDGTTGTITGGNTNGDGGGVNITAGTFTLKGGNIEGNVASNGGGVSVSGQSSYFTMAGGTVRYNAGYTYTGGVLQMSSGKFTMTGGTIQNNVGKVYGGVGIAEAQPSMSGNAVVKDNVFFNDISASNTKITKTESGYTIASGGTPCDVRHATANGLKINVTGAFESGAQIGIFNNNQTAEFTSGFDANNPGGAPADYFFSNDSNRFIMLSANKEAQLGGYFTVIWKNEDGTVLETDENVSTGTTPEFNGTEPTKASDGVATFEFTGWTPAVSPVTGDVTYTATYNAILPDHEHDGIVYKGWASKNSLPTEAGNYYLGYDVTLPSTWTVSKNIRLCLNGNGITKNGDNVITIVGGGNLTIDDCGTKTHYFDVDNGKAVNVNTTPGENRKSFTGGYITGGTGHGYDGYFWNEGGGIYLDGGNLILNGGTILGNSANFGGGVGIYSGTMTMNGGTVCYNTGNAGISFRTGSYDYNRGRGASTGYFVMNGGLVANNSSGVTTAGYSYGNDYATYNGGRIVNNVNTGIYSNNITIAGDIEITGNKYGAGFSNTFSVSGNPVITGNTTSNLSINNGKTINTGTLGENAKIGITMSNPGAFTNGYDANNTIEPTEIFTADDPTTFVEKNAAGEVKLGIYVWTASFNTGGGSGTMDPIEVQKERSFNLPECTFIAPEGKLFLNWSDGTNTYNPGDSYTMTADTAFTAQWIDGIKVSFKANGGSGVMEDVLSYPDYKLPACGFTAPGGKFFNGWLSSADNQVYQTGEVVTLTAETQFTAQWGAEVKYQFDFEDGLPADWQTSNSNWFLNANGGDHIVFPAHSGQKNMTYYRGGYGTYGELLTSSFDMSNAESATLGFWYTNRNWGGDIDQLVVSYRVGEGDWVQLFATSGNHESWTKEEITLPSEAFAKNVCFRFSVNGNYGYGVALDDVELNLTGSQNFFTVTWKNWDGTTLKTDTDVEEGATPTYDGAPPTKPADAQYTYTFAGWNDGTTTYAPDALPAVTGDTTYTAQFTAVPKPHTHDGITFQPWTSTNSLPTTAGNYYLANDVTLSGTWTVPTGTTNLCLNGHGIIRTGSGRVIDLSSSGRNLNIYDCDTVTEHRFTVNNPTENGAGVAVVNDALTENYQTFTGGYITGGNTNNGAGIHVKQATLKLYGGTVIGNSNTGDGGGIYVEQGGNLYIDGGTVSYNQARQGGGIYAPNISSYAKIHLNSGRIEKNYATYTGGGVYGGASVPVYLEGSIVVTGNYSLNAAGVTAAWNLSSARIYVSGSPYVYDNFNANGQSNLSGAYYENTMQITGNLGADCKVGLNGANGLLNYYKSDYTHTDIDPNTLFPYDNNNYILTKDGNDAKRLSIYTVTWNNDDDSLIDKTKVVEGDTPTHAAPTKPDDAQYTYTFAGWQNGTTTYAPDTALPPVTGDTTYTATFTQTEKKLFAKHSIALNGNIGVNFFINSAYADFDGAQTATVVFTWDDGNYTKVVNLKELTKDSDGLYKATCDVVAAHMAHKIHAEVFIDGVLQEETDDFSVQDHAEAILADPAKYDKRNNPEALVALVKEMLNYGAMAQIAFESNLNEKPAPANTKAISDYDYVMADVTADDVLKAIKESNNGKSGADMTAVAASLGANWYTTTMIYMSQNTVKHYFTKATDDFVPTDYQGNQNNYYYYVQKQDIAAAELDGLQTFTVGDVTFQYSALDYVKTVIESNKMEDYAKNIAKALFLYNQAANAYFDTPVIITT